MKESKEAKKERKRIEKAIMRVQIDIRMSASMMNSLLESNISVAHINREYIYQAERLGTSHFRKYNEYKTNLESYENGLNDISLKISMLEEELKELLQEGKKYNVKVIDILKED